VDPRLADLEILSTKHFKCRTSRKRLELLLSPHEQTAIFARQFSIDCEYDSNETWHCSDPKEFVFLKSEEGLPNIRISGGISPESALAAIDRVRDAIRLSTLKFSNRKLASEDIAPLVEIRPVDPRRDHGMWDSGSVGSCTYVVYTEKGSTLCIPEYSDEADRDISVFGPFLTGYQLCYEIKNPAT
jgi:hypothetical protein